MTEPARFQQVEPVVLFAVDGYRYGGKRHDRADVVGELRAGLRAADAAMYRAKSDGKDRVEIVEQRAAEESRSSLA